jgi:hypothetical protein
MKSVTDIMRETSDEACAKIRAIFRTRVESPPSQSTWEAGMEPNRDAPRSNNHPNRGWRNRLQTQADQFIVSEDAKPFTMPLPKTDLEMRKKCRELFVYAYTLGRQSMQRPRPEPGEERKPEG